MKPKKLLLAILCLSLNCALANTNPPTVKNSLSSLRFTSPANEMLPLTLGWGYDQQLMLPTAGGTALKNLDSLPVNYQETSGAVEFTYMDDLEKIANFLNISIQGSGSWGNYSMSAAAQYIQSLVETSYTENFSYLQTFNVKATIDPSSLMHDITSFTPPARGLCKNDPTCQAGINGFTDSYGDTFIQSLPLGYLLLVNFQVQFDAKDYKQKFAASLTGGMQDVFSASTKIENAVEQSGVKGTLKFSARQFGGDPTKLAKVFGTDDAIVSCSLSDLKACKNTITNVLKYAREDLPQQVYFEKSQIVTHGVLSVIGSGDIVFTPYATSFGIVDPPQPDPSVKNARDELAKLYNDVRTKKNFIDHVLDNRNPLRPYLTASAVSRLTKAQTILQGNLHAITPAALNCYLPRTWRSCPVTVAQIQAQQQPVDETLIPYFKQAYVLDLTDQYQILLGEDTNQPGIHHVASFERNLVHKTNIDATWQFLDDGQTLKADGIDENGNHSYGTFKKDSRECYTGIQYVQTASPHNVSFCPQDNPYN